jgi:tetratricopeptide (TPR) repeat protein
MPTPTDNATVALQSESNDTSSRDTGTHLLRGECVGRYVVLDEIGRGGMGRVLRAFDPELQREIALKEVASDRLGREGAQRLVAEARAMAKLSHPNVVAVYGVEELADDRIVLVMEYVAGVTLTPWCVGRSWPEIVTTFVLAGRGLAAAHQAGLLHRDFKPSNVLVCGDAVKVTDFGLAKLAHESDPSDALDAESSSDVALGTEGLTARGIVLGTPRYMAPEQHRGEALTPTVDQYAFCVALWEALSDAPLFSGRDLASLKQAGPPPRSGGSVPRSIVDALRRGLSPAAADRWPSMDALLDALANDAGRRRRRTLIAAASFGAVGLVGWWLWPDPEPERCSSTADQLAGAWDEARREEVRAAMLAVEASYAARVWEQTAARLDEYATEWAAMHVDACMATTVRHEQTPEVMDLRMACLHRAKIDLAAATATLVAADAELVSKAHGLLAGLRPLSRCADLDALRADVDPPLPHEAEAVEHAREQLATARAERRAGRYAAAKQKVADARDALVGIEYAPVQTELALADGWLLADMGDYRGAEASLREALELSTTLRQDRERVSAAVSLLRVVGYQLRRFDEGLRFAELARALAAGDLETEATIESNLVGLRSAQGRPEDAEAAARRALELSVEAGSSDEDIAASRDNLASVFQEQGKLEEAVAEHRRALALWERAMGPEHPSVAMSRNNLGNALRAVGQLDEAEVELRRALELKAAALGAEHPSVASTRGNLATVLLSKGAAAEAEGELRRALTTMEKAMGADDNGVAWLRMSLAGSMDLQRRHADAEVEHRRALEVLSASLDPGHAMLIALQGNLVRNLHAQKRYAEAEALARESLAPLEHARPLDQAQLIEHIARAREAVGDVSGAEAELRRALGVIEAAEGAEHAKAVELRGEIDRVAGRR